MEERIRAILKEETEIPQSVVSAMDTASASIRSGDIHAKKERGWGKSFLPVAACLVLVCSAVFAASGKGIRLWISSLGENKEAAESMVQNPRGIQYTTPEPLLQVEDIYVDGDTLAIAASSRTDDIPKAAKDHVEVNGTDCLLESYQVEENGSIFILVNLNNNLIQDPPSTLDVKFRLYSADSLSDSSATKEFAFSVPVENIGNQSVFLENITISHTGEEKVTAGHVSMTPSRQVLSLTILCFGENAVEQIQFYQGSDWHVEDKNGEVKVEGYFISDSNIQEDGSIQVQMKIEMSSFDISSENLLLVPYSWSYDGDGKRQEGTSVAERDKTMTIPLK